VNYLAHAWTLGEASPELVLGAALPDLLGALDRRAPRLGPVAASELERSGALELARGVRAHHAADVSFHALPAFREACATLRKELAPLDLERVRGFFLAHLLLELLLDASLMERDELLEPRFHAALEAAPRERAAALSPGLDAWIVRFVRARFVRDYASDEGLVLRLEQVLSRARQTLGGGGAARLRAELPRLRALVRGEVDALTLEPRAAVALHLRREASS